ncbi:PIN domain-containing protein [Candidatus Pacearchaeota archaeon]|nr:PIN domain-containing protein [Candidatus Pacearchaeota archaeon]
MNFFDTNILVYAYDFSENEKREKCWKIIKSVFEGEKEGYISNQILAELFYVLTKNMRKQVPIDDINDILLSLLDSHNWKKINYNHLTIKRAMHLSEKYKMHFWDALICATMLENNIFSIYTENEKDFKKIPGLKAINPFS